MRSECSAQQETHEDFGGVSNLGRRLSIDLTAFDGRLLIFSWQARYFVDLKVQISWHAQQFVASRSADSWQAQHFVNPDGRFIALCGS